MADAGHSFQWITLRIWRGTTYVFFQLGSKCDGCVRVTPHRVREKQGTAASDPHVPLFSFAFVSEFRFSFGLISCISEVLSSWRLGSKFKKLR